MPTANIVSSHSEYVIGSSGGGGSLAASAALSNGSLVGNTANTLIPLPSQLLLCLSASLLSILLRRIILIK